MANDDRQQQLYNKYFTPQGGDITSNLFDKYFRGSNEPSAGLFNERMQSIIEKPELLQTKIDQLRALNEEAERYYKTRIQLFGISQEETVQSSKLLKIQEAITQETQKLEKIKSESQAKQLTGEVGQEKMRALPKRPNETEEQYRTRVLGAMAEDIDPRKASTEGLGYRGVVQGVLSGDYGASQLGLGLVNVIKKRAQGKGVIDPITQEFMRIPDWKSYAIRAGMIPGLLYGSSTALPFALQNVNRAYGQMAGDDITRGQAAGYEGSQGFVPGLQGLMNRMMFPFQLAGAPVLGSEAQQFGARRRLEAFKAGINPFDALSIGEAESIQDEVLNRGYIPGSQQERDVTRGLFRLQNRTSIDPGQALDYIDVVVKRLGESMEQAEEDIKEFAQASQAAGKSVDTYTKEVTSIINDLVAQGTSLSQAKVAGQTFSGLRNVPGPDFLNAVSGQNPLLLQEAFRRNPQAFSNPAQLALTLANPLQALGTGGSIEALTGSIKTALDYIRRIPGGEELTDVQRAMLAQNWGWLPGMDQLTPEQIVEIYKGKDDLLQSAQRETRAGELESAFTIARREGIMTRKMKQGKMYGSFETGKEMMDRAFREAPELKNFYDEYWKSISASEEIGKEEKERIRKMLYEEGKSPQEVEKFAQEAIEGTRREGAETYVVLDATPELKRFIRVIDAEYTTVSGETVRLARPRNEYTGKDTTGIGGKFRIPSG